MEKSPEGGAMMRGGKSITREKGQFFGTMDGLRKREGVGKGERWVDLSKRKGSCALEQGSRERSAR